MDGFGVLLLPSVLIALAVLIAFAVSLAFWLRDHTLKRRGWRIVFAKRSATSVPRGFEVKMNTGDQPVFSRKEDDHG